MRFQLASFPALCVLVACSAGGNGDGDPSRSGGIPANGGDSGVDPGGSTGGATSGDPVLDPDDSPGAGGASDECKPKIVGIVRDFVGGEPPDMSPPLNKTESGCNDVFTVVPDMVIPELGEDKKPVYNPNGGHRYRGHLAFAGKDDEGRNLYGREETFNQWYRDTDLNRSIQFELPAKRQANGLWKYESEQFFPIDGQGYADSREGSDGLQHNFFFTFEVHMEFEYQGGEVFNFRGDDDLWVFMNGQLVLDLGGLCWANAPSTSWQGCGVSEAEFCGAGEVNVDAIAAKAGMEPGNTYPLSVFHAERSPQNSVFKLETTLEFTNCDPIIR